MKTHSIFLTCVLSFLFFLPVDAAADADVFAGLVFLDADKNGRHDPGETGIDNVAVTNGITCLKTADGGAFTLPRPDDPMLSEGGVAHISIAAPSGMRPTTPWFLPLPKKSRAASPLKFGLTPEAQALPFNFVHATDSHVPRSGEAMFKAFRKDMAGLAGAVKFCIITGDVVDLSDVRDFKKSEAEYTFLTSQIRDFPMPLYMTPGNHDIAGIRTKKGWDRKHPMYAYGYYTTRVGPLRWSFNYANLHFVALDFNQINDGNWSWGVPQAAADWLKQDLALVDKGVRVFLFVHSPKGCAAFNKVVRTHNIEQIFFGHDHVDRTRMFENVPAICSGSTSQIFRDVDRKPGYRIVHVTDKGWDSFYRETANPHAITLASPRHETVLKKKQTIKGSFYDPEQAITAATITLGKETQTVPFTRGPVCCRFTAKFDLAGINAKKLALTVTLTDKAQKTWTFKHSYKTDKAKAEKK